MVKESFLFLNLFYKRARWENKRFKRLFRAISLNFFLLWESVAVREIFDEKMFSLSITIINLMAITVLTYYHW